MCVLVKILEGHGAGPVSQVECPVHILLSLVVGANQDRTVEEVAEARKARRVEEVVRIGWTVVVVETLPWGSS